MAPVKGPPRAPIRLLVDCPDPVASVAVQLRPASEAAPTAHDPAKDLLPPVAHDAKLGPGIFLIDTQIPIETAIGSYMIDVLCLDGAGTMMINGPVAVAFEVAALPLQVTPSEGPAGTKVKVTGGGCPAGTVSAWVRIGGAEDEVRFFDPEAPTGQQATAVRPDGTFEVTIKVPADLTPGEASIQSFCASQPAEGPPEPLAGPGFAVFVVNALAPTGMDPGTLAAVAIAVVLVGVVLGRARRTCGV